MGQLLGNKETSVLRDGESEDVCTVPDPDIDLDEWGATQPDDTAENNEDDTETTNGGSDPNGSNGDTGGDNGEGEEQNFLDKIQSANGETVNAIIKSEWFPWALAAGFGLLWLRKGN